MFTISVDPVALTIGSIEVRWYGILIALAVLTVVLWGYRQIEPLRRKGELPAPTDINVAPVGIISGIIGAKLVHVLEQPTLYIQNPGAIFSGGGLAIYGGVLGASLGIWIYIKLSRRKRKNQHYGFFIDLVTPGIILAQAIGRIGCTINGCCCGNPAPDWLPWSVVYTHPNSYAMEGSLFLVYLIMYSAWRLGIGYLRTDIQFIFGLSQAQIISLIVLAVSIALLVHMRRRFKLAEQPSIQKEI